MCDHHQCDHVEGRYSGVTQSLDEMQFERGIWAAARDGELSRVAKLLKTVDADVRDSAGYTPLMYACRSGHADIVSLLLSEPTGRASINAATPTGRVVALHRAAYAGSATCVGLLLRHGADVTLCDADGRNSLHKAVEGGSEEVVAAVLEHCRSRRPDLTAPVCGQRDLRGKTPVDYCNGQQLRLVNTYYHRPSQ